MKRLLNLMLLALSSLMVCCSSSNDEQLPPAVEEELALTPAELTIGCDGGMATLQLTSPEDWTLSADGDWLNCYPTSGKSGSAKITVTAAYNDLTEPRNALITVRTASDLAASTLKQEAAPSDEPDEPDEPENPEYPEKPEEPEKPENPEPDEKFVPEGYTLYWSDEFEGEELNVANWSPEIGRGQDGWGNWELQYYTDREENLRVEEGKLVITAIRENYMGAPVTSARLITKNKVYFTYGYVVASIKLPKTADGLWPAFWMMGNDFDSVGWPCCGETDILEMGNSGGIRQGTQERFLNGAMHWGPRWDQHMYYAYDHTHEYSVQDGEFHTFTCIWDEQMVRMYIDLEKYPDATPYFEMNIAAEQVVEYFHKPNFLLLNLAVGGNFPGIHDIEGVTALDNGPARMEVDYVRVFQR